jgi:Protein of unknown function (DUF3303)
MLFMAIERFKNRDAMAVYSRYREKPTGGPDGQMVPGLWKPTARPEGLTLVGNWIEENFDRCFQLMESSDLALMQQWTLGTAYDLLDFEIVPVRTSAETGESIAPYIDKAALRSLDK